MVVPDEVVTHRRGAVPFRKVGQTREDVARPVHSKPAARHALLGGIPSADDDLRFRFAAPRVVFVFRAFQCLCAVCGVCIIDGSVRVFFFFGEVSRGGRGRGRGRG